MKSVKRAIDLLRTFSLEEPELSVTDLSRRLNVHKSTVSRLLSTLEEGGLVNRNPETGRYRLGVGLIELAGLVVLHADLRRLARPFLARLAQLTEETVNLAVLEGDEAINIEHVAPSGRRILNIGWVGRRTPLHASSTGKILLAYLPEDEWSALLHQPLTPFTKYTITDLASLQQELAQVRQQKYATGLEELEIGLNAVAAPVRDHYNRVIAAISTAGPTNRLTRERIEEQTAHQVMDYARQISHALGFATTRDVHL